MVDLACATAINNAYVRLNYILKKTKVALKYIKHSADGRLMVQQRQWIDYLSDEDLGFLKRFLLGSGSLKDLAAQYGISYPTVRLRLDRLIEKVKVIDADPGAGHFETTLRSLYAEGHVDADAFRSLLDAYNSEEESRAAHTA